MRVMDIANNSHKQMQEAVAKTVATSLGPLLQSNNIMRHDYRKLQDDVKELTAKLEEKSTTLDAAINGISDVVYSLRDANDELFANLTTVR